MSLESLKKLSLDEKAKLAIESKDKDVLDLLADCDCDYANIFIARNIYTDWQTLDKLAKSSSRSVRMAVLENPKTFPTTVEKILTAS